MSKLDLDKLEPYAALYAEIISRVEAASDVELTALARAVDLTTDTNCWWATHQVAQILRPFIAGEQVRRAKAAIENAPKPSRIRGALKTG